MDIKTLTKLAKACRKLGVSHLKTPECEIFLSADILPAVKRRSRKSSPVNEALINEPSTDEQVANATKELSDLDLLFWSSDRGRIAQ